MKWRFLALMAVVCMGCGGPTGPVTVAVSGKVTLGGKPLADANVFFASNDGKYTGFGKTDAEGKYKLVQGAKPGANKVYISKIEGELPAGFSEDPESGMDAGQLMAQNLTAPPNKKSNAPKEAVPEIYSSLGKTKLTFEVTSGGNTDVNFDLQ